MMITKPVTIVLLSHEASRRVRFLVFESRHDMYETLKQERDNGWSATSTEGTMLTEEKSTPASHG